MRDDVIRRTLNFLGNPDIKSADIPNVFNLTTAEHRPAGEPDPMTPGIVINPFRNSSSMVWGMVTD